MLMENPLPTIVIDTREQLPYMFRQFGADTETRGLRTGDYSIAGYEDYFAIERKMPGDLLGCMTRERKRFERELQRLSDMDYAAVMVECDLLDLVTIHRGGMNPKSLIATLVAWRTRFRVDFWFAPDRPFAEKLTFTICERYVRDIADGKRPAPGPVEAAA